MHLTLVVSGLLDISAPLLDGIDAGAPALTRLLAAAGAPSVERDGAIAVACTALGIAKQHDWPVAPWLAHAAAIDATAAYWLCADPAIFTVGRGDVRLSAVVGDLESTETTAVLSTINTHFASDGIRFEALDPARWLVGAVATQSLSTLPPEHVIGKPLLGHLPEGTDAARWRNWQNEIQMLLFEHPVNIAREAAGRPVVNSVWFWGGGATASTRPHPRIATLYANAWRLRELARAVDLVCMPLPESLDVLRDKSSRSPAMAWLESPIGADPQQRANWLTALDRDWATPARGAFHNGTIKGLDIVLTGRSSAVHFGGKRLSLARRLQTWRSTPRLSKVLAPYLEASVEMAWNS
jgi:hypothetical protein